jgi:hypothetical protein
MGYGLGIALLLLAAGSSPVALEGLAGVGGGYEGNVTLAATGQPTTGSALATAWAGLGVGWDPGEATHLSAGLRYDGAFYPGATDLSRNAAAADLLWIQEIGEALAVVVAAGGAWSWYGDPARSGPGLSVRASLRVKPWDWMALRAGYAYSQRWAEVEAYSTSANRVFGSVEVRVVSGVYLGLGYAWQTGEQTFYAAAPSPAPAVAPAMAAGPLAGSGPGTGPGTGPGAGPGTGGSPPQGSGVFENLVPYRASATDSTISPTFEAGVWEGLYLFASYSWTWGSSAEGSYTAQFGLAGAGYRF